jgi:uncharacterized protein YjbI with pentapeptide repeats
MTEDNSKTKLLITIPACQILKKISKGDRVEYDRVRIIGKIDLSILKLPMEKVNRNEYQISELHLLEDCKVIKSWIEITNSNFEAPSVVASNTDFDNCLFKSKINFENSSFGYANFKGAMFDGDANFKRVTFSEANFIGATFSGGADFEEAVFLFVDKYKRLQIEGAGYMRVFHGLFYGATFEKLAIFCEATFSEDADFRRTTFSEDADFSGATFSGDADFAILSRFFSRYSADFSKAKFSSKANFTGVTFRGNITFEGAKNEGDYFTFRDATFTYPDSQVEACRRAKNILAKAGNRDEEEYHFYREMEAKRIQKGLRGNSGQGLGYVFFETKIWSFRKLFWYDFFEWLFIQKIFGYGVHPWWLIAWWLIIVAIFASLYAYGHVMKDATNLFDYFKVSFAISIAPGYIAAIINPVNAGYSFTAPFYQMVAIAETVVGTFLWAGFITTFAKKYMR